MKKSFALLFSNSSPLIFPTKSALTLSPFLGQNCSHIPTCSNYAIEAINEWGIFKGSWLAAKRIIRCNPWWGTYGDDPVPKK